MTDPRAAVPGAEWNAQAYDRLANPMQSWGETVLGRSAHAVRSTIVQASRSAGRARQAGVGDMGANGVRGWVPVRLGCVILASRSASTKPRFAELAAQ